MCDSTCMTFQKRHLIAYSLNEKWVTYIQNTKIRELNLSFYLVEYNGKRRDCELFEYQGNALTVIIDNGSLLFQSVSEVNIRYDRRMWFRLGVQLT